MSSESILCRLVEQDYGLEGSGNWYRAIDHNSLVVDAEKGIFYWNSKGISGDAFIYLTKVRGLNYKDAKDYLRSAGFVGTFIHEVKDGEETIVYPKLVDVFHEEIWNVDRQYFYNRTITDETISRYKLGFHGGFYTIPIYQDGVFKQFQMRRDSPKLIKNYYKGVGPLLFNSDIMKVTDRIFLTEGLMGAIVLNQNGLPAISMNIGSEGFQSEWIKYFIHQKRIDILFDNDSAGVIGAIRTAKILGVSRCHIYTFSDFDGKGFASDDFFIEGGTKAELLELVESNSVYAFEVERRSNKR